MKHFKISSTKPVKQNELLYLVKIIGKYEKSEIYPNLSDIKNGLRVIQRELKNNKRSVSKSQIKKFLHPTQISIINRMKTFNGTPPKYNISVPFQSSIIFEQIISIINNNPKLLRKCKKKYFFENSSSHCLCRNALIPDFYEAINTVESSLVKQRRKTFNELQRISLKTCKN